MSIYKIFPTKDASIYSEYTTKNTGLDEILDLSKTLNATNTALGSISYETSRFLIQFPTSEILSVFQNYIQTSSYDCYLKLYLSYASEIPTNYTLITYPISESWEMGTGRINNIPITTNGVSWKYRNYNDGIEWTTSSFTANTTASYSGSNAGGGTWYSNQYATQSFTYYTEKDLEFKVTSMVTSFYSGTIENNGFIILKSGSEFIGPSPYALNYFSRDTNTIYPPVLEIKWNDYIFSTGSSTYPITNNLNSVVTINNNVGKYDENSIVKFRVKVRDRYPTRNFQTSSLYLNNKYLPISSSYCVKDLDTNEIIIDFDDVYTKISADSTSNYFTLFMNGLQKERYYKILIKSNFDNEVIIFDDNFFFKVV